MQTRKRKLFLPCRISLSEFLNKKYERYDGKYVIPYFVKKMLRQKFNMVMKELKDIANYFQTEILDYIPGEFSFCIKPDFVWNVINGYHGRTM